MSCDAQGWPVKLKGARNNKMQRTVAIGTLAGQTTVVLFRQDLDFATGELYVTDADGTLVRGYVTINNETPSRISAQQASAGFEAQKQWWMDWLSDSQHP